MMYIPKCIRLLFIVGASVIWFRRLVLILGISVVLILGISVVLILGISLVLILGISILRLIKLV